MDQRGRESISQTFEERDQYGVAVAPYLLYLLHKNGNCSKQEFCETCGELLGGRVDELQCNTGDLAGNPD